MTEFFDRIKLSTGWVLSSNESTSFAGSAFLFRQDGDTQYWFTCHHVIMNLPALFIRIEINGEASVRSADYIKKSSRPLHDIAVLKTTEHNWADLKPIPMGDPFAAKPDPQGYRLFLYGYAKDKNSEHPLPRSIRSTFSRHDHGYYYLTSNAISDDRRLHTVDSCEWQTPVKEPLEIATYELQEQGHHLLPGLSGAPVCYQTPDLDLACFGMFSQIWYGRSSDPQGGVAIKFSDLLAAAGPLIPLYPYADCLIVTVAATRDEIIDANKGYKVGEEPNWWSNMAQEAFYDGYRDNWRPFGESIDAKMSVVDLLNQAVHSVVTCQSISDYATEANEISRIMTNFSGVLFIFDPCSTNIKSLRGVFDVANQFRWKASYLIVCCERRVTDTRLLTAMASTVRGKLQEVTNDPYCEERVEDARRAGEFNKSAIRLIDSTVKIGRAAWEANPQVKRRLEMILARAGGNASADTFFLRRVPAF